MSSQCLKKGEKILSKTISLLCVVSKLLESCILNNIRLHLQIVINRCQHRFTPGKSCNTQLVQVIDSIGKLLDQGEQTDVVYLDMSKGCFPLGGIFRAQRNFSSFVSSQAELIGKRQRKIALCAENSA